MTETEFIKKKLRLQASAFISFMGLFAVVFPFLDPKFKEITKDWEIADKKLNQEFEERKSDG